MGYNVIRMLLIMDAPAYALQLTFVAGIVADCEANGIKVIFTIGRSDNDHAAIEAEWATIIGLYDSSPAVIAYDLVNEPHLFTSYVGGMVTRMRGLTNKTFIIEAGDGYGDSDFATLTPVADTNVIYSTHIYYHGDFTHQGIKGRPTGKTWPGVYSGSLRDKQDIINENVARIIAFQKAHDVRVLIGETGVSKYADSASIAQYKKDVAEICREHGWEYITHSYPEEDFKL